MSTSTGKTRRTQEERRAESERKLFDALVQIIINDGISAATCENIGQLAGYSRGLTTTRLGRREEMFSKLIQRLRAARLQKLQAALSDEMSRSEALRVFIDTHFDDLESDPTYIAYFVLAAGSLTEIPMLRDEIVEAHDFVQRLLEGFVREGVESGEFDPDTDAASTAFSLFCYLFGAAMQKHIYLKKPVSILKQGAYALLPAAK